MPYNFVAESFHTKILRYYDAILLDLRVGTLLEEEEKKEERNFVTDFLQAKCDFRWKWPFRVFEPPLGSLEATYDVHLRLIEKRVVDFLLVLIELFVLGATAEALRCRRIFMLELPKPKTDNIRSLQSSLIM